MSKIEEYEKVNACDPGDVVLIDGSKGTRIIDASLIGSGNNKKADAIIDTVSGPIVSFSDAGDNQPVDSCVAQIEPIQWNTPSPEHVAPILGFTGCNVFRTAKNIVGGTAFRDAIKDALPGATVNADEGYITVAATASVRNALFTHFKENTVYTFILTLYKTAAGGSNLKVTYTDGTSAVIPNVPVGSEKCTIVFVSASNKTIRSFVKANSSGVIRVYYNESGIFEGELTEEEFVAYAGETTTIAFPEEAGTVYGGTLDVTNGVLEVTYGEIESYNGETLPGEWLSSMDVYDPETTPTIGAQVVYELAEPITYHVTPTEIRTILGECSIYADTGDISVGYAVDTKTYIDNQIAALVATLSTL